MSPAALPRHNMYIAVQHYKYAAVRSVGPPPKVSFMGIHCSANCQLERDRYQSEIVPLLKLDPGEPVPEAQACSPFLLLHDYLP